MSIGRFLISTGRRRRPEGLLGHGIKAFAALTAVWVVYAATWSDMAVLAQTILFLALMLVLVFLIITPSEGDPEAEPPRNVHPIDLALAAAALATGIYFYLRAATIAERIALMDPLTTADIVIGSLILVLTVEAMRRTVGMILTVVVLLFIAYNLFGDLLPGRLAHGEIGYRHFLDLMAFTTDGLFGAPLRVAATYAFLFVLFGTILSKVGGSEFFFNLAASLSGRTTGGPAKIAVISSGLYGTISGSPTSDVVTTGSITIPMMKKLGYRPAVAGGVEVAASTGGSILPPVMGSAAFIMAEYTGIAYVDIMVAAVVPALLYYLAVLTQVHLRARRYNLGSLDPATIPSVLRTLKDGGLFIVPLAVITWALLDGYTPTYSAFYGLVAVLVIAMLRRDTRPSPAKLYEALAEGSLRMVGVAGACAAAGLVIGGITMTGLAGKVAGMVLSVTDANVLLSLLLVAVVTLILGLGMPTPSAYAMAAVLVAPLLQKLGLPLMNAHLFVLYFAVMSAMTPPVAVAAYAASAIAEANPVGIAGMAMRLAAGAFLLPFAFALDSGLLLSGSMGNIALAIVTAAMAMMIIAAAAEGFFLVPLLAFERLALFAAGLCLLYPTSLFLVIAAGLAALGAARPILARRSRGPT